MSVNVGLIGAGVWGEIHGKAYKMSNVANFVAVCDLIPEKAKAFAEKYGAKRVYVDYQEMLKDSEIQAIAVATPDFAHKEPVLAAAAAGKHVLVEKPMATSLADAVEMVEAARKAGVILMPDFHNRWNPSFISALESIEDGELGNPKYIYIRHSNTKYVPFKMLNWSKKSNVLWFLGAHSCDLVRFIMRSDVVKAYTVSRKGILKDYGIDIPDFFVTILEFENGGVASIENAWILPDVLQSIGEFRAEILCEYGTHIVDFNTSNACVTFAEKNGRGLARDLYAENIVYGKLKGFVFDSILHFLECVESGKEPIVSPMDGVENTRILEAMSKSLDTGNPVEISR
jgi:predicted dehydrogenase